MNERQDPDKGAVKRTIEILVDNESGVLARIVGHISGRGLNISGTTIEECREGAALARITIVFLATDMLAEQIVNQVDKLVPTHMVVDLSNKKFIERKLVLVKVTPTEGVSFAKLISMAKTQNGKLENRRTHKADGFAIFAHAGFVEGCTRFIKLMERFGKVEVRGSGPVVMV